MRVKSELDGSTTTGGSSGTFEMKLEGNSSRPDAFHLLEVSEDMVMILSQQQPVVACALPQACSGTGVCLEPAGVVLYPG